MVSLQLNQRTDYGLAALLYLAGRSQESLTSLQEISDSTDIPVEFLRKIFQQLAKAGVIHSLKGRRGGVRLARRPEEITLLEVVESLEKTMGLVRCLRGEFCPRSDTCPASRFWHEALVQFRQSLRNVTISELAGMDTSKATKKA